MAHKKKKSVKKSKIETREIKGHRPDYIPEFKKPSKSVFGSTLGTFGERFHLLPIT